MPIVLQFSDEFALPSDVCFTLCDVVSAHILLLPRQSCRDGLHLAAHTISTSRVGNVSGDAIRLKRRFRNCGNSLTNRACAITPAAWRCSLRSFAPHPCSATWPRSVGPGLA